MLKPRLTGWERLQAQSPVNCKAITRPAVTLLLGRRLNVN